MDDQRTDREVGRLKRFSLRDILLLFVIVALAVGWWMDRRPRPVRFEMHVNDHHVFVVDTSTGQVWSERVDAGRLVPKDAEISLPKIHK